MRKRSATAVTQLGIPLTMLSGDILTVDACVVIFATFNGRSWPRCVSKYGVCMGLHRRKNVTFAGRHSDAGNISSVPIYGPEQC